ncbi:hypothetical protein ACN5PR_002262 [Cronobacter dublinensis]
MGSIDFTKALDPLGLFTKEKTPEIKTTSQPTTDDAINQADELLRRRQRQGVNANMLSGPGGDSSASSSGQKTLLGG